MQLFRKLSSKNKNQYSRFIKKVLFVLSIFLLPFFYFLYTETANASLLSLIFNVTSDQVSANVINSTEDTLNSQNMNVLKISSNSPIVSDFSKNHSILVSENALMAEIGPSGTISDIEESINNEISTYVVRSGDTLSGIAKIFGVSVNTIIWANNISQNSTLKEGQTLIILPITGIRHVIKKGENIKSIVLKYKADLNEVIQYNDLSMNSVLMEGDTIIIPDVEPTVEVKSSSGKMNTSVVYTKGPSYSGYYMRPINGGRKSQGIHGHNGVDLAAPIDTPIYASASGVVIASVNDRGWHGGYGNYVVISHSNGTQTLYAHTAINIVSIGQYVDKGDMIARIGMTGKTTGPHVHFEVRGARNPF